MMETRAVRTREDPKEDAVAELAAILMVAAIAIVVRGIRNCYVMS